MENKLVTLKFHVKGKFIGRPSFLTYVGGQIQEIEDIDTDYLSSIELRVMLNETLGCQDVENIHYKVPNIPLSEGLCLIYDDNSIRSMLADCDGCSSIEIFVEHKKDGAEVAQENVTENRILDEGTWENEVNHLLESECIDGGEYYDLTGVGFASDYETESENEVHDEVVLPSGTVEAFHDGIEDDDDDSSVFSFGSSECGSFISTDDDSEAEHATREPSRFLSYNPKSDAPNFEIGMTFEGREQFKDAITAYSIKMHKGIKLEKNDKIRVQAICKGKNCPWKIYASYDKPSKHFMVKTYVNDHKCSRTFKNSRITSVFLAKKYASRIRCDPSWKLREFKEAVKEDLGVDVHETKCMRAKTLVLRKLEGCYKDEYKRIWDYKEELKRSNPNNTIEIKVDRPFPHELPVFRRMYVCLDTLKKGFLAGCRKFVGLDGSFLKGMVKGEVLTAVGKDGNDQIYPIAWAVVEVENKDSWAWFLLLLKDDLGIGNGEGWTIISDQQKGLIPSIAELLPYVEQRMCARHIYANWRKNYPNKSYQRLFWNCAKATTEGQFNKELEILVKATGSTFEDILKVSPQFWCRAWFSEQNKCDSCDNNCSESFNKNLVEARRKPVLSLLEDIRMLAYKRIQQRRVKSSRWTSLHCPRIIKKLGKNIDKSEHCHVVWNGKNGFEVSHYDDKFVVDLRKLTCSCRAWEVSGIPCPHAISAIFHEGKEPASYLAHWFLKETYMKTYEYCLEPINGRNLWPKSSMPPMKEPLPRKMPGRPSQVKRRKEIGEPSNKNRTKMSRLGRVMTCSNCKMTGHNKKGCQRRADISATVNTSSTVEGRGTIRTRGTSIYRGRGRGRGSVNPVTGTRNSNVGRQSATKSSPSGYGLFICPNTGSSIWHGLHTQRVLHSGATSQVPSQMHGTQESVAANDAAGTSSGINRVI